MCDEIGFATLKLDGIEMICSEITISQRAGEYPQIDIKGVVGVKNDYSITNESCRAAFGLKSIEEIAKELAALSERQKDNPND